MANFARCFFWLLSTSVLLLPRSTESQSKAAAHVLITNAKECWDTCVCGSQVRKGNRRLIEVVQAVVYISCKSVSGAGYPRIRTIATIWPLW